MCRNTYTKWCKKIQLSCVHLYSGVNKGEMQQVIDNKKVAKCLKTFEKNQKNDKKSL